MRVPSLPTVLRGLRSSAAVAAFLLALGATALAQTSQFSVVHNFGDGGNNGAHSISGLVQSANGNFYGTTARGGYSNNGTVFQLTPGGDFNILFAFNGGGRGGEPAAALALGTDGNFYGTTQFGGYYDEGVAFRLTSAGDYTVLFDFGGNYGAEPVASLTLGTDGNFYGTTQFGGYYDAGTVFQLTPDGTLTVLYDFGGDYGSQPVSSLTLAADGTFYGTTANGGYYNNGTVFQITTGGALTVLHDFEGREGASPEGALTLAADGTFYGTTADGGYNGYGTVFQIAADGTFTDRHDFTGYDGRDPQAALILASDGNLYGTAYYGGGKDEGTVYEITANGTFLTAISFDRTEGQYPAGSLLQAADGTLYGTTYGGGPSDDGTIFHFSLDTLATPVVTVSSSGTSKARISRTGSVDQPLTVSYQLKGGAVGGTAVIPAGARSIKFKVAPAGGAATVKIKLMAPSDGRYTLGSPRKAVIPMSASE